MTVLIADTLCLNNYLQFDVYTGRRLLYKDFLRLSYQLASSLQNCGYKKNDVVAICSENNNNFFIPVVSALYLGMVSAPINHTYTQSEYMVIISIFLMNNVFLGEILHAMNITKPKVVFCSEAVVSHIEKLAKIVNYIERIIILDSHAKVAGYDTIKEFIKKNFRNLSLEEFKPVELNPFEHLAVVLCSSGTTGLPKGVMTTHDNISVRNNHMR